MEDEDWARMTSALELLNNRDIWIVDATDLTVEQIRAIAETHKRRYPHLAMIMVDYMGLIKSLRLSVTISPSRTFPET
jgi:replicative DNA helicase